MTTPNLCCSFLDRGRISRVVMRAEREGIIPASDGLHTRMDLTATHINGCPLDFERMMTCDSTTLAHDIHGIDRYLDRKTGRLGGCFLPRCAIRQDSAAPGLRTSADTLKLGNLVGRRLHDVVLPSGRTVRGLVTADAIAMMKAEGAMALPRS